MRRPGRLMIDALDEETLRYEKVLLFADCDNTRIGANNKIAAYSDETIRDLQPGDQVTGFEIIASLPLEEQRHLLPVVDKIEYLCSLHKQKVADEYALMALYTYKGNDEFEVAE